MKKKYIEHYLVHLKIEHIFKCIIYAGYNGFDIDIVRKAEEELTNIEKYILSTKKRGKK